MGWSNTLGGLPLNKTPFSMLLCRPRFRIDLAVAYKTLEVRASFTDSDGPAPFLGSRSRTRPLRSRTRPFPPLSVLTRPFTHPYRSHQPLSFFSIPPCLRILPTSLAASVSATASLSSTHPLVHFWRALFITTAPSPALFPLLPPPLLVSRPSRAGPLAN